MSATATQVSESSDAARQHGTDEPQKHTLAKKILTIQAAVGTVKKKGKFGTEMGSANFLRIEDAVMAVGKLMSQQGLILTGSLAKRPDGSLWYERTPHIKGGKDGEFRAGYITSVVFDWTIEDVDSGETKTWQIPGEGFDSTDKGTPKAQTSSRKYAIIDIFQLAVGNDIESPSEATFEQGREKQKAVAASKLADAAGRGNKTAIDALSQIEPPKKVMIRRPEEHNGHYITVEGYIANPPMDKFFTDTDSKRFKRPGGVVYWRVPAEYEKGVIDLCAKLGIEVEG